MSPSKPELAPHQPAAALPPTAAPDQHQIPTGNCVRGHVPAVCPRPDAPETPGQERHIGPLKQTQLFCLTPDLLHFGVHTHNARSRSPNLTLTQKKKKKKEKLPFPPAAVSASDPCSQQNRGFNPLSLLADLGWQALRPLATVSTVRRPAASSSSAGQRWPVQTGCHVQELRSWSPAEPASLSHLMVCVTIN